jgi:3-deoxy-D-manno-octulosonic-acid transferase
MYFLYSLLYTLAFVIMSPLFLLRRDKYSAGFSDRLGFYPEFVKDERPVIWLHCVSVGETNAARPLVDEIFSRFPGHRLIVSTTTKTGQTLASDIFKGKADAVFYFPFDWKFSVWRALERFQPSIVLLMETEIWPRFFHETRLADTKLAIVNGRLSEKSFNRYSYIKSFIRNVLGNVDLALMQGEADAERIRSLGIDTDRVFVTGNLKFDHSINEVENALTSELRQRFAIDGKRLLIVAASIEILDGKTEVFRLLIAPRHPERFDEVAQLIRETSHSFVRRSDAANEADKESDIILLDSIGELRAVYPLADIVFVGGSLIPHGGQSILEPAAAGKAIVTGPFTHNFDDVVKEFLSRDALIQTPEVPQDFQNPERLYEAFVDLFEHLEKRRKLGENALTVMEANRGATTKTLEYLSPLLGPRENQ